MPIWIILLCWGIAILLGVLGGVITNMGKDAPAEKDVDSVSPDSGQKKHWTEDMADPEVHPQRHWTEFLDNHDEAVDRDDDWEGERVDDWGDPW